MLNFSFDQDRMPGRDFAPASLVIAGWAGRDEAGVRHHIDELAAIGVPPPSTVPLFYRCSTQLLTQAERIEVLGEDSSGEVEPVILVMPDGLWLTVGSDHTDRKAETYGVALSKQMCPKPVARQAWRLDEVEDRWDELVLRSYATIGGKRVLYQEGHLSALRTPQDLIARHSGSTGLPIGSVMFGGTLSAIGGVRPGSFFEMELIDPASQRTIRHAYEIITLPVVV